MSLQINNLTKNYGSQTALNRINLTIDRHEIIGLLGPNGAGKSTLMKSIVGALDIEAGEIIFNGADIRTNPKQTKKQIGFLPENNPLYIDMYVQEFLGFAAQLHQVQTTRVQKVIELVGLQPERNKKIGQLSKGYRQRVGLAHAILHEPELLILDEPTNGLDPNQILEIRSVIREIGRHKTVLLSTHLMQEVEALCTRVILLHKGSVIQDTSIEDFRGKYESLEQAFATYTN